MASPTAPLKCYLTDYINKLIFSAITKLSPRVNLLGTVFFARIRGLFSKKGGVSAQKNLLKGGFLLTD